MITATTWFAVAVGGAAGAPARFLLDRWVTGRVSGSAGLGRFPWGLLVVNTLGSAIAGIVLATTTGDLRYLLLAGLCGGFTTFSGFAWEADRLWSGARDMFWWAVVAMPVTCIATFVAGWRLAALTTG